RKPRPPLTGGGNPWPEPPSPSARPKPAPTAPPPSTSSAATRVPAPPRPQPSPEPRHRPRGGGVPRRDADDVDASGEGGGVERHLAPAGGEASRGDGGDAAAEHVVDGDLRLRGASEREGHRGLPSKGVRAHLPPQPLPLHLRPRLRRHRHHLRRPPHPPPIEPVVEQPHVQPTVRTQRCRCQV